MSYNPNVVVLEQHERRDLVIECPTLCTEHGCTEHTGQEWRKSARIPVGTSIDDARVIMERHAATYHKSGPYRLVEYVTVSRRTMEVIEP